MVVALGPGKFYGSSLPRPRFYTDIKLNDERVDSPLPVNGALMTWADEAHWSMGGLSFTRQRLQGRIEGKVENLRRQRERDFKTKSRKEKKAVKGGKDKISERVDDTPSPPPAPVALKRRRVVGLVDDDDEVEERFDVKSGTVRKLGDDFELVAKESGMVAETIDASIAGRTRSKKNESDQGGIKMGKRKFVKGGKKVAAAAATVGMRSSPRLTKIRGI